MSFNPTFIHYYNPVYVASWNTDEVESTDFCKTLWNWQILGNKNHTTTSTIWYVFIQFLLFIIKKKVNWLHTFFTEVKKNKKRGRLFTSFICISW